MRLNIIVSKQRKDGLSATNPEDILINTDAYWLSRDIIFTHDLKINQSRIREVRRRDGRFYIAGYEHGDKNVAISVEVVYPSKETPLLVGVMGKIYPKDDDRIIFELPLSDDEYSLAMAKKDGFEIDRYDFSKDPYPYADPDIIDTTYHNGYQRTSDYPDVTYEKLIGETLRVFVDIDYTAGAEEV